MKVTSERMKRFKPWIGDHYACGSGLGCKLLIVGESHYADPKNTREVRDANFTVNGIKSIVAGGSWASLRYFQALSKVFQQKTGCLGNDCWQHVAFYNYIPEFMPKPRQAPKRLYLHVKRVHCNGDNGNPLQIGRDKRGTLLVPNDKKQVAATYLRWPTVYAAKDAKWARALIDRVASKQNNSPTPQT